MAYRESETEDKIMRDRIRAILEEKSRDSSYTGSAFVGGANFLDVRIPYKCARKKKVVKKKKKVKKKKIVVKAAPKARKKKAVPKPAPPRPKKIVLPLKKRRKVGKNPWRTYFTKMKLENPKMSMKAISQQYKNQ